MGKSMVRARRAVVPRGSTLSTGRGPEGCGSQHMGLEGNVPGWTLRSASSCVGSADVLREGSEALFSVSA